MNYKFPHTIENCIGEKIIFQSWDLSTDKVIVESYCKPGAGPTMHTHLKQEESLTVASGKMGYQILGEETKYANMGETVLFTRGTPHKFWAEGDQDLKINGWIQPAHNVVFFLSTLYAAQNKSGNAQPDAFDGAFLLHNYANEYELPEIPGFVRKVIFPITVFIGNAIGKYKHLKDAPKPL
jgi:mannose-6-phosphate isomerase-like protein (cupin superfamily)